MRLLFSAHNDDSELFCSVIAQRMRPVTICIITDSHIQAERGTGITAAQRRRESLAAAEVLGAPICFLGIRDTSLTADALLEALAVFDRNVEAIIPALQGGNPHHDLVSRVCADRFRRHRYYATYAKGEHFTPLTELNEPGHGAVKVYVIEPTAEEAALKEAALGCHRSQLGYAATRPHFEAVRGKPEYLTELIG